MESIARVGQIDENGKTPAVYRPTVPTPRIRHPAENRPTVSRSARPRRPTPPRAKRPTQPTTTRMTIRTMAADRKTTRRLSIRKTGNTKISGSKGILTPRPFARSGGSSGRPSAGNGTSPSRSTSTPRHPASPHDLAQPGAAPPRPRPSPLSAAVPHSPHTGKLISTGSQATGACQTKFIGRSPGFKRYTPKITVRKPVRAYGTAGQTSQPPRAESGWKNQQHPPVDTWLLRPQHASPSSDARTLHLPEFPTEFTVFQGAEPLCPCMYNPSSRPSGRSLGASRSYSPPSKPHSRAALLSTLAEHLAPSRSYSPPARFTPSRSYSRPREASPDRLAPSRSSSHLQVARLRQVPGHR